MADLPASSVLRLGDGRSLGVVEAGDRRGPAVFYFNGYPASRLEALTLSDAAGSMGVRVIGLDRPGIGQSSPKPGFDFLDWPADVTEGADRLGIGAFSVLGFSGGAPFAMACALRQPDRVRACGLLSSAMPVAFIRRAVRWQTALAWRVMEWTPSRLFDRLADAAMGGLPHADEAAVDGRLVRRAPNQGAADGAALGDARFRGILAAAVVESYRQGSAANRRFARLLTRPWSFAPGDIGATRTFLWHGEQDRVMPPAGARRLAAAIPGCRATFWSDEGHLSPLANRGREILTALAGAERAMPV